MEKTRNLRKLGAREHVMRDGHSQRQKRYLDLTEDIRKNWQEYTESESES